MNKKIMITGILLIVLSWLGNFIYFQSYQLEEPLFMNHYYEQGVRESVIFDLHYLTNKNDSLSVYRIEIPGIPSEKIRISDHYSRYYQQHNLESIRVEITDEEINSWLNEDPLVFNEIVVYFNNGSSQRADIGEVMLYKTDTIDWEDSGLSHASGGSSSNGKSYTLYKVEEPLRVLSFEYDHKEELEGFLHLFMNPSDVSLDEIIQSERALLESINEEDPNAQELRRTHERMREVREGLFQIDGLNIKDVHFPMEFHQDEHIKINHYFASSKENDPRYHLFFHIEASLLVETKEGIRERRSYHIQDTPHFSSQQIREIIRERR